VKIGLRALRVSFGGEAEMGWARASDNGRKRIAAMQRLQACAMWHFLRAGFCRMRSGRNRRENRRCGWNPAPEKLTGLSIE
jgi:hypothetical protein